MARTSRALPAVLLVFLAASGVAGVIGPAGVAGATETSLYLRMELAAPIGGGFESFFTPADGTFSAVYRAPETVSVRFSSPDRPSGRALTFAAPGGETIAPGYYRDARAYPFHDPSGPGLCISGLSFGCLELTGSFVVKELVIGPDDEVISFRAIFEQHRNDDVPGLLGEIRFDSEAGLVLRGPLERPVERTARLSFGAQGSGPGGEAAALSADGLPPGAMFADGGDGTATLTWTPPFEEGGFHEVTLRATAGAASDTLTTRIEVTGVTSLVVEPDPDDPFWEGQRFFLYPEEGDFDIRRNIDNSVLVGFDATFERWRVEFKAPFDAPLEVGVYEGATKFPDPSEPGFNIFGNAHGYININATFEVKQVDYGAGDEIEAFWATFEMVAGSSGFPLRGEVRYHADVETLVRAPVRASVPADVGKLRLDVRAFSATGDPPALRPEALPTGAFFADRRDGTGFLTWEPETSQTGVHTIVFRGEATGGGTDRAATDVSVLPSNDDFDNAIGARTVPFSAAGDNSTATTALDDPLTHCGGRSNTVWYAFTPTQGGRVIASITESETNLVLTAYTGTRGILHEIGCSSMGTGPGSRVELDVVPGETYYFMVSSSFFGGGQFVFNLHPPLAVGVRVERRATLDSFVSRAEIVATITCSRPVSVNIDAVIEQARGQQTRAGEASLSVACPGERTLSISIHPIGGSFRPGPATATVAVRAFDPTTGEQAQAEVTQEILLRRAPRQR